MVGDPRGRSRRGCDRVDGAHRPRHRRAVPARPAPCRDGRPDGQGLVARAGFRAAGRRGRRRRPRARHPHRDDGRGIDGLRLDRLALAAGTRRAGLDPRAAGRHARIVMGRNPSPLAPGSSDRPDVIGTRARPRCPVCEEPGTPLHHDLRDAVWGAPGRWTLDRCPDPACGTLWLDPAPREEDMAIAYARYQTHASAQRGVNAPVGSLMAMAKRGYLRRRWHYAGLGNGVGPRLLGWIFGGLPQQRARLDAAIFHLDGRRPGRLLDVGCGAGDAIERMAALGWRAEGVDTDPAAVAVARNRGLTVHEGTLDRLRLEPESFDAVTLSHVIEHVPDPRALLGECRRLLTPGGALFIETPNARSWLHARFGRHWRGLEPPRHFQVFTPASLARLVAGQDLQVSHLATSAKAASFTFAASRAAAHAERRGVPSCDAFGAGLRRAGAIAAAAEWTLGRVAKDRGEEIVVFATRAGRSG
ncbi:MAG: methyltransferase domain-containing protein [Deltaproteobacteria bacterium]|nr:MAG: methyltransferase domain-containing protein [Deltaproteobacteria bacterium]